MWAASPSGTPLEMAKAKGVAYAEQINEIFKGILVEGYRGNHYFFSF